MKIEVGKRARANSDRSREPTTSSRPPTSAARALELRSSSSALPGCEQEAGSDTEELQRKPIPVCDANTISPLYFCIIVLQVTKGMYSKSLQILQANIQRKILYLKTYLLAIFVPI